MRKITFLLTYLMLNPAAGFNPSALPGVRFPSIVNSHLAMSTAQTHEELLYGGIIHQGVLVSSTERAMKFYRDLLGMEDQTHMRPNLPFPGAFLGVGGHQIHLMEAGNDAIPENPDPTSGRPEHGGRDRHIALTIKSLAPLKATLDAAGHVYTMSKSGRAALFCRDPDGNALEFMETPSIGEDQA
mmetsp:Transcript_134260/g.237577  ORF Transcript_134260/g.237577 Transcript_134260/m.237577 type:complete len:185 (-) Transcript_134260:250-804(-)